MKKATNDNTRRFADKALVSYFIPKAGINVMIKHTAEQYPANKALGSIPATE